MTDKRKQAEHRAKDAIQAITEALSVINHPDVHRVLSTEERTALVLAREWIRHGLEGDGLSFEDYWGH